MDIKAENNNAARIRKADHSFVPPLVNRHSRILVLGSMLSPKSAEAGFYYAHPQNRFWRVICALFGEEYTTDNNRRACIALDNGIALWDVLKSCDIIGASDSTIKNAVYNDISGLLKKYPNIQSVYTTGKKAYALLCEYNKTVNNELVNNAVCLPSTSPQNFTYKLDALLEAYSVIKN